MPPAVAVADLWGKTRQLPVTLQTSAYTTSYWSLQLPAEDEADNERTLVQDMAKFRRAILTNPEFADLTPAERQTLKHLIVDRLSSAQIMRLRRTSAAAVSQQVRNIRRKSRKFNTLWTLMHGKRLGVEGASAELPWHESLAFPVDLICRSDAEQLSNDWGGSHRRGGRE